MRHSKFDPYIKDIAYYLNLGYPVASVAEELDKYFNDIVDEGALYAFIHSRGLKIDSDRKLRVPHCDSCKDCHAVIDTNNREVKMCHFCRLIPKVMTSPIWCPKRMKAERVS